MHQVRHHEVRARRQGSQLRHVQAACGQDDLSGRRPQEGGFLEGPAARELQSIRVTVASTTLAVSNGHLDKPSTPLPPADPAPTKEPPDPPTDPPPKSKPPRKAAASPRQHHPAIRAADPSCGAIAVPDYTPFMLNAASKHEFGVDGDKSGIILLKGIAGTMPATLL